MHVRRVTTNINQGTFLLLFASATRKTFTSELVCIQIRLTYSSENVLDSASVTECVKRREEERAGEEQGK